MGIAYRAPAAGDAPRDPARETVRAALDELAAALENARRRLGV